MRLVNMKKSLQFQTLSYVIHYLRTHSTRQLIFTPWITATVRKTKRQVPFLGPNFLCLGDANWKSSDPNVMVQFSIDFHFFVTHVRTAISLFTTFVTIIQSVGRLCELDNSVHTFWTQNKASFRTQSTFINVSAYLVIYAYILHFSLLSVCLQSSKQSTYVANTEIRVHLERLHILACFVTRAFFSSCVNTCKEDEKLQKLFSGSVLPAQFSICSLILCITFLEIQYPRFNLPK